MKKQALIYISIILLTALRIQAEKEHYYVEAGNSDTSSAHEEAGSLNEEPANAEAGNVGEMPPKKEAGTWSAASGREPTQIAEERD